MSSSSLIRICLHGTPANFLNPGFTSPVCVSLSTALATRTLRYPARRRYATAAGSTTSTTASSSSAAPPPPIPSSSPEPGNGPLEPKRRTRIPRGIFWAVGFFCFGMVGGQTITSLVNGGTDSPAPGSLEDQARVADVHKRASKLEIIKLLDSDPRYTSWDAYPDIWKTEDHGLHRLTTGALRGSKGIGAYHRVWHDQETGECISVIFLGDSITGWPFVIHGGLISTLLDESLGRAALLRFPEKTGVTANLEINFLKPSTTNNFYVIRTHLSDKDKTDRKQWVEGTFETKEGVVLATGKALFVVPKGYKLGPVEGL